MLTYFIYNELIREVKYFGFYTEYELSIDFFVKHISKQQGHTLPGNHLNTIRRFNPPSLEYDLMYGIVPLLKMLVDLSLQDLIPQIQQSFENSLNENAILFHNVIYSLTNEKYPSFIVDILQYPPFMLKGIMGHFYVTNVERNSNEKRDYFECPGKQLNFAAYVTTVNVYEIPEIVILLSMLIRFITQLISRVKPFLMTGQIVFHFGEVYMEVESFIKSYKEDVMHKFAAYIPNDTKEYFVNFHFVDELDLLHPDLNLAKAISHIAFVKSDIEYKYD